MMSQDWSIIDRYRNQTRDDMPMDETITGFADRIIDLAEQVITEQGGQRLNINGRIVYQIPLERPANIVPMLTLDEQKARLCSKMQSEIEKSIVSQSNDRKLARAAYSAICLDLARPLRQKYPKQWAKALDALNLYPKVVQVIFFHCPFPAGDQLREKAIAAGLKKPQQEIRIW